MRRLLLGILLCTTGPCGGNADALEETPAAILHPERDCGCGLQMRGGYHAPVHVTERTRRNPSLRP